MEAQTRVNRLERLRLRVVGSSCAACILPIRRELERIKGVEWVGANPVLDLIFVDYDPTLVEIREIVAAAKRSGHDAVPVAM